MQIRHRLLGKKVPSSHGIRESAYCPTCHVYFSLGEFDDKGHTYSADIAQWRRKYWNAMTGVQKIAAS